MAAHSAAASIPPVPPDQPPGAWPAWLREMAQGINLLAARVNDPPIPVEAADDAAAAAAGVPVGGMYRIGSALQVRVV